MAEQQGMGPAKGANGAAELQAGDFGILTQMLKQHDGSSAKELTARLQATHGDSFDKKRVNAILYRMENARLARREMLGVTPYWHLV